MRVRIVVFALITLNVSILFASPLRRLVSFVHDQGYTSYTLLIPAITVYLVWDRRSAIFRTVGTSLWPALLFAAAGVWTCFLAAHYASVLNANNYLSLITLSFSFFLVATFVGTFGHHAGRSACFPLALLFFLAPFPSQVNETLIRWLQHGSAELVYLLFSILRVPVLRDGLVFTVPGVSIEVATECSGINSSIALLLVSLLIAHESFQTTSSRVIFVLASLPLSFVKNAVRIVTLTLLAIYVDMSFLTGPLHHRGGIVFFLVTLALMLPIWKALKKREGRLLSRSTIVAAAREQTP